MPQIGMEVGLKENMMAGGLWSEEYKMMEVMEETFLYYLQPTWEVDYPLPYGLEMPSHVGSYNGKGDPDNYLHLFEGAIRMHKWGMPVSCHMFTYTLKDFARKKFTNTHLGVHNVKQRDGESTRAFVTQYTNDTLKILGLHEEQRISHGPSYYLQWFNKHFSWDNSKGKKKNQDRFSPYKGSNHGLLTNLSNSPREILAMEKVAKTFEQPLLIVGNRQSRGMSKYCRMKPTIIGS
uniref:Uncharacterized protein n=1 Tax=Tanacetum cinerariifolium TaxID=118510 RepID=A0A699K152_TANCI|nr:hypothetical protein [Tanacetum cinerariifolium]